MLYKRWRKTLRSRYSGTGFKPPLGAVIKSDGTERRRKRLDETSQVSDMELNESEQTDEASKWEDTVKTTLVGNGEDKLNGNLITG